VSVTCPDGLQHKGVANLGVRPTVDGKTPYLEVHIFDFNDNLYQHYIEVSFLEKLRDEKKFDSLEKLVEQIKIDIANAKERHRHYE
jgi:riboflavin kinase/FMN adenylyltransferase